MFDSFIKSAEKIGKSLANKGPNKKIKEDFLEDLLGLKKKDNTENIAETIPEENKKSDSSSESRGRITLQIKPFRDNEFTVAYWQGFLKNFGKISQQIDFIVSGNRMGIKMYVNLPHELMNYFENVFYATFPTSELQRVDVEFKPVTNFVWFNEPTQVATDSNFTREGKYLDPFKDVLSIYDMIDTEKTFQINYSLRFSKEVTFWDKFFAFWKKFFSKPKEADPADAKKDKELPIDGYLSLGFTSDVTDKYIQDNIKNNVKSVMRKFLQDGGIEMQNLPKYSPLNVIQIANFFHLPTKEFFIKGLDYSVYRKLPPAPNLPTLENSVKNDVTLLGTTEYRNDKIKFGIRTEDKFRHMYIVGKTGTGKSTFISNMIKSDMMANKGLCLIDPHGDLVDTVIEHIPSYRTNDVILFDVSDTEHPLGFNLLAYNSPDEKNLIVSGIVGTFQKIYGNSRGPRLEYILRNVMLAIVEYPNSTLQHIMRMLIEKNFREEVLSHVTDPVTLKFRRTEYDKWTDKFRDEAIAPITNKVGQFLSSPIVRNIFGQPSSKLNMRKVMDEGKILLVNLSKGKIGEDNSEMIGSFLVTKIQIDAMGRADMAFKDRREFYLYIDEFQNFATESFAVILSEARKYKLSLIVANQYTSQLDPLIRDAIFGNVGTIFSFTLGYEDATVMASQFKDMISPNDILSLPKFKAYTKLMIDGITSDPFSMSTLPLQSPDLSEEIRDKIKKQSRQRYAMERGKLEELMKAWNAKTFSPQEKIMEKALQESTSNNAEETKKSDGTPVASTSQSVPASIESLKIGDVFDGYVKLKYNYGVFVIVGTFEGLLHKNFIKVPDGIERKSFLNIGDKIRVKVEGFKEIDGIKRVVWTQ